MAILDEPAGTPSSHGRTGTHPASTGMIPADAAIFPTDAAIILADAATSGGRQHPGRPAGPRPGTGRNLPSELVPIALLPFALLVSAAGLWPLWHRQPVLAGVTTLVVAALVTTGVVLLTEPAQRAPGVGLILAGGLLELSWCNEWGGGPLPMLSLLEGHGWLFVVGWVLYRYPSPRLGRFERRSFQLMAVWVLVWPWAVILTSRPNWREYPGNAWWPAQWPDRSVHEIATWTVDVTAVAALALYVGLWVRRARADRAAQHTRSTPSAAAAVIGAICGALVPFADAARLPLPVVDQLDTVATVGVLAVPGALLVAVVRRHLSRAGLTGLLVDLRGATGAESALHALRRALDDPGLVVGLWSEPGQAYLDDAGTPVPEPADDTRPVARVTSAAGDPLALVIGTVGPHTDADLFAAATAAFGLSLENARLLETAGRQLAELRAETARAAAAAQIERRRLEQDLHDGAQMRFLALAPLIGAAQARTGDPATSAALAEIKRELAGALAELRRLAHGEHPPGGASPGGLSAALQPLAAACGLPVRLDLPRHRLPAAVEGTAYLVICEALTNAVKHSAAGRVTVEGRVEDGTLVVTVRDDGRGGAPDSTSAAGDGAGGLGLSGMAARAAAAGGSLSVLSPVDGGTTVTLELPCG